MAEQTAYDAIVVGGGPGGATTARELANRSDKSVAVLEARDEPHAQCAGGLGGPLLEEANLAGRIPDDVKTAEIQEVEIRTPNNKFFIRNEELDQDLDYLGLTVNRQAFDNWLLFDLAAGAGADIHTNHQVANIDPQDNGYELEVEVQSGAAKWELDDDGNPVEDPVEMDSAKSHTETWTCEYLVLAAGPNYRLAEQVGFGDLRPDPEDIHFAYQYHVVDEEWPQDRLLLYVDDEYAPKGYVWGFPEGDSHYDDGPVVRWGNGVPKYVGNPRKYLDRFMEDTGRDDLKEVNLTAGQIPTCTVPDSAQNGNCLLVGDNARQVDPLHGGGMMNGSIAGIHAAEAIARDDPSYYDPAWKDALKDMLDRRYTMKQMIYDEFDDEQWDRWAAIAQDYEITSINPDAEIPRFVAHSVKEDPSLFPGYVADQFKGYLGDAYESVRDRMTGD